VHAATDTDLAIDASPAHLTGVRVTEAIGALVAADAARFADPDSIIQLHRDLTRLEAFVTAATAAFDAAKEWEPDGAQGAAPWIARRCSLPASVARRRVSLGRRLRRADALVEMATRSATVPAGGRRPAPLFSVFVGYETLHGRICELAHGTVVAPGALLPWLDQAYIERAVFSPGPRVEVSATARLFTGATRREIELRDRGCTHEFCDKTASECQVDHIVPNARGGPTTQANGQMNCGFHNRLKGEGPPPDP